MTKMDDRPSQELITLREFFEYRIAQLEEKIDDLATSIKEQTASSVKKAQFDQIQSEVSSIREMLTKENTGVLDRLRNVEGVSKIALRISGAIGAAGGGIIMTLLIAWLKQKLGI